MEVAMCSARRGGMPRRVSRRNPRRTECWGAAPLHIPTRHMSVPLLCEKGGWGLWSHQLGEKCDERGGGESGVGQELAAVQKGHVTFLLRHAKGLGGARARRGAHAAAELRTRTRGNQGCDLLLRVGGWVLQVVWRRGVEGRAVTRADDASVVEILTDHPPLGEDVW